MAPSIRFFLCFVCAIGLSACESAERELIRDLPTDVTYHSAALQKEAHVVRTEGNVPHVYASTRHDTAYVLGFTTARDRFFEMDLGRRVGTGRVSELLGDPGLDLDEQSRLTGITYLTDQIATKLGGELGDYVDAYVAGVNDYIEQAKAGTLAPPSEYVLAAPLLGATSAGDVMQPFVRRDITALVAVTIYQSSFEPGDIGRASVVAAMPHAFDGAPDEALRKAGLQQDIWSLELPIFVVSSAPGLGTSYGKHPFAPALSTSTSRLSQSPATSSALLTRLNAAMTKMQIRFHRDREVGYGSNAFAVAGFATQDGNAIMAGDGHLSLAVPSVLYQLGIDTSVFGGGDIHELGLTIPGFPIMAIGTNGKVAWSQTQLGEDITDWFREIIQLDALGNPIASKWGDAWMPLQRIDESYIVANVPALNSTGRTETWARYQTFDGRWIADFEGRPVQSTDAVGPGESIQYGMSGYVVPGDADGDGIVTAVSFIYAGLFAGETLGATDLLGHANDIEEFRQATRGVVGYSQNFAVADATGNILYTSYQPIPCRSDLPRNADGSFVAGADPTLLLDGTKYGAWRIPIKNGQADEAAGASDPQACLVPFDKVPQSVNPDNGYVVTCNNDPGGLSFDNDVFNDEVYLGGPWDNAFRADSISRALRKHIAANDVGVQAMAEVQGNVDSRLGELFTPGLLIAVDEARATAATNPSDHAAALYALAPGAFDEMERRLAAWRDRGYQAKSGVRTFYRDPSAIDIEDSIATMIFNAWVRNFRARVFDDEGIDDIFGTLGSESEIKVLVHLLSNRGPSGQGVLASWEPTRQESVYFDDILTVDHIETSNEDMMLALVDAYAFLRAMPDSLGVGGFGTDDMTQWLWGLRHQAEFLSIIEDFIGDSSSLTLLTDQQQISTDLLPLNPPGEKFPPGDPRLDLTWFPRDGDQYGVDAANPGLSGRLFLHAAGPVMRMVFELSSRGVRGQNILPAGQSELIGDPHYADQARLWLENRAYPMRFDPSSVANGAIAHEVFLPNGL